MVTVISAEAACSGVTQKDISVNAISISSPEHDVRRIIYTPAIKQLNQAAEAMHEYPRC
jgi:hypothetical protein